MLHLPETGSPWDALVGGSIHLTGAGFWCSAGAEASGGMNMSKQNGAMLASNNSFKLKD
jgi:hypothetical protein